jgi:hypothetical protein
VLRESFERAHILADQFWGAVVVVDDCEDAVDDGVVGLDETDDDAEDDVCEGVGETVDLGLDEGADGGFAWFAFASEAG